MNKYLYYVVYAGGSNGSSVTGSSTLESITPIRSSTDVSNMARFISEKVKLDNCMIFSWTPLEFNSVKESIVTASCRCSECNLLLEDLIQLGSEASRVYVNFCPTCGSKLMWSEYVGKEDSDI